METEQRWGWQGVLAVVQAISKDQPGAFQYPGGAWACPPSVRSPATYLDDGTVCATFEVGGKPYEIAVKVTPR